MKALARFAALALPVSPLAAADHAEAIEADLDLPPRLDISKFIDATTFGATASHGMDFNELTRGDVDFSEARLWTFLSKPIDLGGDWSLLPSLNYTFSRLETDVSPLTPGPLPPRFDESLHEVSLPTIFYHSSRGSRWYYGAYVEPAIRSDFSSVDSRDFFLSAALAAAYQVNDCLVVGFGVYASDITNDPFLVAGPGFVWTPTPDWLVTYYGPKFIARREFGERHRLGFEAAWNGGQWNVDTPGFFGSQSAKLDYSSIRAGFYWKYNLVSELWLELGAGMTFGNELRLESPGGRDQYPLAYGEMDGAPYVSLGLSVNRW